MLYYCTQYSISLWCTNCYTQQVVQSCIQKMADAPIIGKEDYLTLITCNGDVTIRAKCPAQKYKHARLERDIAAKPGNTGTTRLWDGMMESYRDMKKHDEQTRNGKKVLRYMLAFTDGGDNASRTDPHEVRITLCILTVFCMQ